MLTYDFKLGKSVRVHHGITAVLRRDVPGPYRHCKNGASIRNLKPLAILCGCTARFVSDLVGNPEYRVSCGSIDTNTNRTNAIALEKMVLNKRQKLRH